MVEKFGRRYRSSKYIFNGRLLGCIFDSINTNVINTMVERKKIN